MRIWQAGKKRQAQQYISIGDEAIIITSINYQNGEVKGMRGDEQFIVYMTQRNTWTSASNEKQA